MKVLTVTEKEIQMVMNALNGYPTVCKSTVANKIQAVLRKHGTGGCWRNFYENIYPDLKESVYKMPWEERFNCWLLSHFGFQVSYFDYLPPHTRDFSRELGGYSIFQL